MNKEIIFLVHPFYDVQASLEALRNNNKLSSNDEKIQRLLLCLKKARYLSRTYFFEVKKYLENNPESYILAIKPNYAPFPEVAAYLDKMARISNKIVIISPELINTLDHKSSLLEKSHMRISGRLEAQSILDMGIKTLLERGYQVESYKSSKINYKVAGEWEGLCVNLMKSGIMELFPNKFETRSRIPEIPEITFSQLNYHESLAIIEKGRVISIN